LAPSSVPMVSAPFIANFMFPGAGRFLAGGRDLLGQVGRRVDVVPVLHVEVGDEHDAQADR
jgi:hypothetical protein